MDATTLYRLIECAPIAKSNPQVKHSINQARELAKIPKGKREMVIKDATTKAKSVGRKLTAKDYQMLHNRRPSPSQPSPYQDNPQIDLGHPMEKGLAAERGSFMAWIRTRPVEENPARFQCDSCEAEFPDDSEAVTLYECNGCGTTVHQEKHRPMITTSVSTVINLDTRFLIAVARSAMKVNWSAKRRDKTMNDTPKISAARLRERCLIATVLNTPASHTRHCYSGQSWTITSFSKTQVQEFWPMP